MILTSHQTADLEGAIGMAKKYWEDLKSAAGGAVETLKNNLTPNERKR